MSRGPERANLGSGHLLSYALTPVFFVVRIEHVWRLRVANDTRYLEKCPLLGGKADA